jgi:glutaredoxin-related protein
MDLMNDPKVDLNRVNIGGKIKAIKSWKDIPDALVNSAFQGGNK